jgi:ribosomal protein L7/L12
MHVHINPSDIRIDMGSDGVVSISEALKIAANGGKITTIKLFRALIPNLGLKDAKEMVETMGDKCKPYNRDNAEIERLRNNNATLQQELNKLREKMERIQDVLDS